MISNGKKIAVVGTGISGLIAAYLLSPKNEVEVFESNNYIGGHTRTITVEIDSQSYPIDTGFIVYNEWTYPNFMKVLAKNRIQSQSTNMSFSLSCEETGLEYNGTSFNGLFAQKKNLLRPSYYKMVYDIIRFNREAKNFLKESKESKISFDKFLKNLNFDRNIQDFYIYPMASAIWSAAPAMIAQAPFQFFARFFDNHGMLNIQDRPKWRVIQGGSREYIKRLISGFQNKIRLNCPVKKIFRKNDSVKLAIFDEEKTFDYVVLANHSDQALRLLSNPTKDEEKILGSIHYQENEAVLHTDSKVLPKSKKAWASWNYHKQKKEVNRTCVTYNMNMLQNLNAKSTFCVSLNYGHRIDPEKVINTTTFHHPVITPEGIEAQKRHHEINGINRTFYCGAYWGSGFHEDGVNSALKVCKYFGRSL